jgi:prepilin-type N-terminal cleavage/methylation domain-containing protein
MRRCASSRDRGFTLLELSLAMAVAGVLVALLVAAWLQANREGVRYAREVAEDRSTREMERWLEAMVNGAQWSASSHLPQGSMRWEAAPRAFSLWSREGAGLPGPARWHLTAEGGGLDIFIEDAQGEGTRHRRWEGVADLRLDLAQRRVEGTGERMDWFTVDQWDGALPFRPAAIRVTWLTAKGEMRWVTAWS